MRLTEEHRAWVESLKVGDPVQVGVVSTRGTAQALEIHNEFMRAKVSAVTPDEIEAESLQNGKTLTFTPTGICKEWDTMVLWKEGMRP